MSRRAAFAGAALIVALRSAAGEAEEKVDKLLSENRFAEALDELGRCKGEEEKAAAVRLFVESSLALREAVIGAVKQGRKVRFFDRFLGQPVRAKVVLASEDGLVVDYLGTEAEKGWTEIPPARLARMALSAAGDEGGTLLSAYRVASATGNDKLAAGLLRSLTERHPGLLKEAERPIFASFSEAKGPAKRPSARRPVALVSKGPTFRVVVPEEDPDRLLKLPDAGLQSRCFSAARANYLPEANVFYTRYTWRKWGLRGEKRTGHYKAWMQRKRYMSLRMYCNRPEDVPEGLDVPIHDGGGGHVSPVYWDQKYIDAHREFVQAVGRELAQDPYLAYVDIGGVGNTGGEWLVYGDFSAVGYDAENKDMLLWETVRMYREAFPHTRLYLATAAMSYARDRAALKRYCRENNIGFRLDGLCGVTYDPNGWQRRARIHELWKDFPFQWEGAYSTMEWEKEGWDTSRVMEAALEFGPQMITYADNDNDAVRFWKDPVKREIIRKAGLRLGYRFVVTKARYMDAVRPKGTLSLDLVFANRGCSKCHAERELEVSFLTSRGAPAWAVRIRPAPPVSSWMPGEEVMVRLSIRLPGGLPPGKYMLAVAMMDHHPLRPNSRIPMAMKERTPDHRYFLGGVTVR